jgi:hypothetical protein
MTSCVAFTVDDYCDDEDEAIALSLAMAESESVPQATVPVSEAKFNKARLRRSKTTASVPTIAILEDTDEDDKSNNKDDDTREGKHDEQEDALSIDYDPDAQAAQEVLKTANQLSAHILEVMMGWFAARGKGYTSEQPEAAATINHLHNASYSPKADGMTPSTTTTTTTNGIVKTTDAARKATTAVATAASLGLIVDGALAVSGESLSFCRDSSDSPHDWIPASLMEQICPKIKLPDYQLVGVNWLALLHKMRCQVEGEKAKQEQPNIYDSQKKMRYTNVNGILADEMGLVR